MSITSHSIELPAETKREEISPPQSTHRRPHTLQQQMRQWLLCVAMLVWFVVSLSSVVAVHWWQFSTQQYCIGICIKSNQGQARGSLKIEHDTRQNKYQYVLYTMFINCWSVNGGSDFNSSCDWFLFDFNTITILSWLRISRCNDGIYLSPVTRMYVPYDSMFLLFSPGVLPFIFTHCYKRIIVRFCVCVMTDWWYDWWLVYLLVWHQSKVVINLWGMYLWLTDWLFYAIKWNATTEIQYSDWW